MDVVSSEKHRNSHKKLINLHPDFLIFHWIMGKYAWTDIIMYNSK